ncbi:MAG: Nif3-like dinuclear metal center hexameric protein, partial [Rhodospirillales bacterium]|nr:Nif3-like dinuclear metal center hexameric protein [Rhodospirillales bacterium]
HPPIFQPLERLTTATWKQRLILEAARQGVAIYSPHTALDAARGGTNDWLCEGIHGEAGASSIEVIQPHTPENDLYKIVAFVPTEAVDAVRTAMSRGGAGWIGNYSGCSFNAPGFGTFFPEEGATPSIGEVGKFEHVDEVRVEMICPQCAVGTTLAALREAHPYEEPAYDVFKLAPYFEPAGEQTGQGRIVRFEQPIELAELVQRVRARLSVADLQVITANTDKKVATVGVCVGAGGSVFEQCGLLDAYVTGEMRHHQQLDLREQGAAVILAGHTQTERPYLQRYRDRIIEAGGGEIDWFVSERDDAPQR